MISRMLALTAAWIWLMIVAAPFGRTAGPEHQLPGALPQGQASEPLASTSPQRALLDRYCVTCHNQKTKTAGLALDALDLVDVGQSAAIWEKVIRKVRAGLMPPPGRPRPDNAEADEFASSLETAVDRASAAHVNPGRTETFHRLNRVEYRNAIRDLLALDIDVTSLLPADDASYGFDNIAGVLKINQTQMERYLSASRKISRVAVGRSIPPTSETFHISSEASQSERVDGLPLGTRGGMVVRYNFPQDAEYVIKVELGCSANFKELQCNGSLGFAEPHQLEITVDGTRAGLFTLNPRTMNLGYPNEPVPGENVENVNEGRYQVVRVPVKAGPRDVGVTFLKGTSVEYVRGTYRLRFVKPYKFFADAMAIAEPFVDNVEISGPFDASGSGDTPSRRRIFACRPASSAEERGCAKTVLSTLARRAYRRPATDADLQELLTLYNEGRTDGGFDAGIELALRRLLVAPKFLFRIERDPVKVTPNTVYRISDLELASRLSFFLWSSVPDDELLDVAIRGTLKNPKVLEQQVKRMLADARSQALVDNFFGQWLGLRHVGAVRPSEALFPDFDDTLRQALKRETELFVQSIVVEDRSVLELLTATYTFVNERLARHYRIPHVKGPDFRRITYSDDRRVGLLGQGSILTLTSHGIRTSPVIRGKWILENILGTPPPEPPPNVPALKEREAESTGTARSMRDRMAEHRSNPACASCHAMIDPVGFALENFDAVGRWREVDEAYAPIDASGQLPDGSKFSDLAGFRKALTSHPERFVTFATEKLLTYALGRGLEHYDMPAVRKIQRAAAPNAYRFSSLILGIVNSAPFQMRRSQAAATQSAARH